MLTVERCSQPCTRGIHHVHTYVFGTFDSTWATNVHCLQLLGSKLVLKNSMFLSWPLLMSLSAMMIGPNIEKLT